MKNINLQDKFTIENRFFIAIAIQLLILVILSMYTLVSNSVGLRTNILNMGAATETDDQLVFQGIQNGGYGIFSISEFMTNEEFDIGDTIYVEVNDTRGYSNVINVYSDSTVYKYDAKAERLYMNSNRKYDYTFLLKGTVESFEQPHYSTSKKWLRVRYDGFTLNKSDYTQKQIDEIKSKSAFFEIRPKKDGSFEVIEIWVGNKRWPKAY